MNHENKEALNLLKTAKGQIEAVMKMTEDQRYCIDISTQIQAIQSLLKKANLSILKTHLNTCVMESFNDGSSVEKIDEIMKLLDKYIK